MQNCLEKGVIFYFSLLLLPSSFSKQHPRCNPRCSRTRNHEACIDGEALLELTRNDSDLLGPDSPRSHGLQATVVSRLHVFEPCNGIGMRDVCGYTRLKATQLDQTSSTDDSSSDREAEARKRHALLLSLYPRSRLSPSVVAVCTRHSRLFLATRSLL